MKQVLFPISICLLLLLSACQESNTRSTPSPNNNSVAAPNSLKKLFAPNSKVFRGVDFSMGKSKIGGNETANSLKSNKGTTLKYEVIMGSSDFADIEYIFEGNTLNTIQVYIYLKNKASSQKIYGDIEQFFNKKYKKRKAIWEGEENKTPFTIFAKKISSGNNQGIYLVWEKI